jgi:hypothetical protein
MGRIGRGGKKGNAILELQGNPRGLTEFTSPSRAAERLPGTDTR